MDHIGNMEYYSGRYFDWNVTFEPVEYHSLCRIHNPEGYATSATTSNGPIYYYYRRDHLGNNREVWPVPYTFSNGTTSTATTVQRTQYYPSGLPWASNSGDNPWVQDNKYNGKEFVEMHGYDTYDIVWRQYYPAIGRFQSIDPEIEQAYNESPYAMCDNNMVNRTDPDGRFWGNVVGAVVGGGVELAGQAIAQLATGKNIKNIDIDWVDVGAATLEGGLTAGGSVLRKVVVTSVSAGVQAAFDDNNNILTGNKSFTQAGKEFAGNMVTAGIGAGTQKIANASTKEAVSTANKQAARANNAITTAERRLSNSPNSPKAQTNVNNSRSNAQRARNNQVRTQMNHNTVGNTNVNVKGQKVNGAQQTANTGANAAKNTIVDEKK